MPRGTGMTPPQKKKVTQAPPKARAPRATRKRPETTENLPDTKPIASSIPPMLQRYRGDVHNELMKELGCQNPMAVPRIQKIVLNIGLGESLQNARALETAAADLATISGQRPVTTRARQSIAGFKIRKGMPIGVMVTLRKARMWEFLDKLINAALPRIRDFRGVSGKAFDGRGNFSLGLKEQVVFPEIEYSSVDKLRGLQVSIVTTAKTDEEGRKLLQQLGMPFSKS